MAAPLSAVQGVGSNNTIPSLAQAPFTQLYAGPGRPDYTVEREVSFLHPGYEGEGERNVLLRLYAYDAVDATRKGIHAGTARLCCAIIACNAWAGTLESQDEGSRGEAVQDYNTILLGSRYSFHVKDPVESQGAKQPYQYPVCPSFRQWLFPKDTIGSAINPEPERHPNPNPPLMVGASLQTLVSARDGHCLLSHWDESTNAVHLVPRAEEDWFLSQDMHDYIDNRLLLKDAALNDIRNGITLRADIHKAFDDGKFAFVPKGGEWVVHFLKPSRCYGPYHNQVIPFHPEISTAFLLARLAWAILPQAAVFLETFHTRMVKVRDGTTGKPRTERRPGWDFVCDYIQKGGSETSGLGSGSGKKRRPSGRDVDDMSVVWVQDHMCEWLEFLGNADDSISEDSIAIDSSPVRHSAQSVPLSTA